VLNPIRNLRRAAGPSRRALLATAAAFALLPTAGRADQVDLSVYTYEDTRQLVTLVCDAAELMTRVGETAFDEFQVPNSRWRYGQFYIFVYAVDGTSVFHPVTPELVGHNLIEMRDIGGRAVIRNITDVARRPEPDASGWVFYLWEDHARLSPSWKAAFIRKVVTPDGKVYALGSGTFSPKIERIFVRQNVDRAVRLLSRDGRAAFERLHDPDFALLDTYVFVMDARGQLLVDPVFPTLEPRDMWGFTDAVGTRVIQDVLRRLAREDEVWMTFLMPQPGSSLPSRRALYARKVKLDNETLFVGSDCFLATPIWMKVGTNTTWLRDRPT
jgi:signal transduction histidine kinase